MYAFVNASVGFDQYCSWSQSMLWHVCEGDKEHVIEFLSTLFFFLFSSQGKKLHMDIGAFFPS